MCNSEVSGLGTMKIIGKGTIHWLIVTDDGKTITLTIHNCYHVPAIPVRLFSPQKIVDNTQHLLMQTYT